MVAVLTNERGQTERNRIEKLKEALRPEKYPMSVELNRLYTEGYKASEAKGDSIILQVAKGLANQLDKITIFIEDGELIVGNLQSKPMGLELSGHWTREELEDLAQDVGCTFTDEEAAEAVSLWEYWRTKGFQYREAKIIDDEKLWPYLQAGVVLPQWKDREDGPKMGNAGGVFGIAGSFIVVDFEKVLTGGLNKIVEEAKQELRNTRITSADSVKKKDFLNSVIICHKAIIRFANRFAVRATEMAAKETDPARKKELERIAVTCQWVPANPARDFYEAMQSFWFIFMMLVCAVFPFGRFDQFMYPFYKKDIQEGKITDEEVLELLQCLRIKDMQTNTTFNREQRKKRGGFAKWNNMVIGGVTPEGKDATNELTYLILESAKRCPTPHPTITLRVHDGTPEALMMKSLELVKTGIGMPAFVSDNSYIEFLLSLGATLKDARDYAIAGCLDACVAGKSRIGRMPVFIIPRVFDFFLHNGVDTKTGQQWGPKTGDIESFKTFDAFMKAWKEHFAYWIGCQAECDNIEILARNEVTPNPISSSLVVDAIKVGKNYLDRPFPIENGAAIIACGMINVVDSMAAVKKLVFEEKKVTMKELKTALDANWQGYEKMRKMFLAAPKYGNDDDYVDSIATELYRFFADEVTSYDTVFGGKCVPSGVSVTAHWPGGELTCATPDGRFAGEVLADGTHSPAQGRDTHGPTAVLKSAAKIDQGSFQSTLLNMKFDPSALKSTEDLRKLSDLIRTYFGEGGKHIQINVVDRETLLDAQKHPEKHRDLIVRVAGYSAYFVQLAKPLQDEVINRSGQAKAA
jgi:formate C-acetyltransferase